jgi:transposase
MSYQYKTGVPREQGLLLPPSLEEYIAVDNPVRAIDAYVESLDLAQLGFQYTVGGGGAGQPPYAPGTLLKLYMWGYLNRTRRSRRLELETYRNLEVIWLLRELHPCYKTIADFRKENATALKAVYQDFLLVCRELDLFGGSLVGIDSVFLEGNASKASIFTGKRLQSLLGRLEDKIAAYLTLLDQGDAEAVDASPEDDALADKIKVLQTRQQTYQDLLEELQVSEETQISCPDADARLLNKKTDKGPTAGYNAQCAIDSKHKLIVACDVVNDGNDSHQLSSMALQAKENMASEDLTAAADTGYYAHQELKDCEDAGITVYVPEPDTSAAVRNQGRFPREDFTYDAQANVYRCPADKVLTPCGTRQQDGKKKFQYRSTAKVCADCPLRAKCLPKKSPYRTIYRWEHEEVVERHRQRMQEGGAAYMRKRFGLVEHPFGTLKVWCGWTHFLVRGLTKVRGEFSLLATCYNFTRVLNILGIETFQAYCHQRQSLLFAL